MAAGARQPSKKLAQVVIGDERAASELARHEVSVADRGVHGISAEAGERARLGDRVCGARPVLESGASNNGNLLSAPSSDGLQTEVGKRKC